MKFNIGQFIGLNTDQRASLAASSSRDADNIFLAVLSLESDDAFTKGRELLSDLADFYFESAGAPAEKINLTFAEGLARLKKSPAEEGIGADKYSLLLGIISGKILYLIGEGEVEAYLRRDGKLSSLVAMGTSGQLISGFLEAGDRLLLATQSLTSFLSDELTTVLSSPIDTFEDEVSSKIAAVNLENQNLAGLVFELPEEEIAIPTLSESGTEAANQPAGGFSQSDYGATSTGSLVNIINRVKQMIAGSNFSLNRFFPRSGRGRLMLATILILLLIFGIGLKYKNSQDKQKQIAFNQQLQKARDDYNAAQGLQNLNPADAKTKLDAARNEVDSALKIKPKDQEALALKKQIEDNAGTILQQFAASSFPLFLDLDLVKKNFRADKMGLSNGKLLLLDPAVKTLVLIDTSKKSNQILAGSDQLGDAQLASLNGGLAFVYSKDKGIIRLDTTNLKQVVAAKKDSDLAQVADIYGFAGNVYLLDSKNNKIWKYLPTTEGYSDKREYLSKDTKVDFSNALRMQIESSIYVMQKGGEILRFTKGDKDNFSLGGLDKGIKDPKSFFISSDTDNLYLLDSGNSRMLVLTKTGQFKAQYQGDKFGSATDLVVDEIGKKIYLLDGGKIYTSELK